MLGLCYNHLPIMYIINKDIGSHVAMMHGTRHRTARQKTLTWRTTPSSRIVMLVDHPQLVHDSTTPNHELQSRGEQPFPVQLQGPPSVLIRWEKGNNFFVLFAEYYASVIDFVFDSIEIG